MVSGIKTATLIVEMPLAEKGDLIRIELERDDVRYLVMHQGLLQTVDPEGDRVDRAVYLILAELAGMKAQPDSVGTRQLSS